MPEKFTKVSTDDVEDIGRKLDKRNNELKGINSKLTTLDGINSKLTTLDGINSKLESIGDDTNGLNTKFDTFNSNFESYNYNLIKILEKLAGK